MSKRSNPNLRKNGGKGTFFGNLLRGIVKTGKSVGAPLLDAVTGGTVSDIVQAISGDKELSQEDKEMLLAEMQKDVKLEQEITKRWEADAKSDSWLSKNIRPLVVANFTLLIDVVIISSIAGKNLGEAYIPILMTMGVTAIGGYFTLREYGKSRKN
ncbi:hypothetical protein [Pseudotenacibaculum haliotis]|uniref:Uncharacterized protein n=1 Tax=Pseudotenacibaculum haliotis TaxID=1862138 RepID=A0ABW5LML3_9FLAO